MHNKGFGFAVVNQPLDNHLFMTPDIIVLSMLPLFCLQYRFNTDTGPFYIDDAQAAWKLA